VNRRAATAVPPAALVAAAAGAQALLARGARPSPGSLALATPAAVLAGALLGDAVLRFRRARTTVDPTAPGSATHLVVTGANRVSRNPMYAGMAAALLAHAVARRSWAALVPAAGFVAVLSAGQIAAEEAALADRFGEEYARYRAAVPRWVDARSLGGVARAVADRAR
jgi:protein-S-isoprenylcysteine O-methyltransferase Ste14